MVRITGERLYEGWTSSSCLSLLSLCQSDHVLTSIHEKHDKACGGDPVTHPAIDHFRIDKKSGTIEWMDATSGDYLPFEALCAKTKCAKTAAPSTSRRTEG